MVHWFHLHHRGLHTGLIVVRLQLDSVAEDVCGEYDLPEHLVKRCLIRIFKLAQSLCTVTQNALCCLMETCHPLVITEVCYVSRQLEAVFVVRELFVTLLTVVESFGCSITFFLQSAEGQAWYRQLSLPQSNTVATELVSLSQLFSLDVAECFPASVGSASCRPQLGQ